MITWKPWGREKIIYRGKWFVKKIVVTEGCRTSLQYHKKKFEVWFFEDGTVKVIPPMAVHRLVGPITVIEVAYGDDQDVVRLEDDYGRTTPSHEMQNDLVERGS